MEYSDIHHQPSSSSSATVSSKGGPAIDRHNPIIQDQKRLTKTLPNSTNNINNKSRKSKIHNDQKTEPIVLVDETTDDEELIITNKNNNNNTNTNTNNNNVVRRQGGVLFGWGCTRPGDFISPASSSRFLLTDKALSDQFDPLLKQGSSPAPQHPLQPPEEETVRSEDDVSCKKKDDDNLSSSPVITPPSSSLSSSSSDHQVVVLRVSLHCRGCEKKMRKHLSKMEGVTSFTVDFISKTVTVAGDITPLDVLMSVSKVKNAKLLTPTTISLPPEPRMESNLSVVDKNL